MKNPASTMSAGLSTQQHERSAALPAHRVLASQTLMVASLLPLQNRRLGSSTWAGSQEIEVMNLRWPCRRTSKSEQGARQQLGRRTQQVT